MCGGDPFAPKGGVAETGSEFTDTVPDLSRLWIAPILVPITELTKEAASVTMLALTTEGRWQELMGTASEGRGVRRQAMPPGRAVS